MSSLSTQYPASDSRVAGVISCGVVTLLTSYMAVGLRLWARKQTVFGQGIDDYMIIVAVVRTIRQMAQNARSFDVSY